MGRSPQPAWCGVRAATATGNHSMQRKDTALTNEELFRVGLADLVPPTQRGRLPLPWKLAWFLLAYAAFVGLPVGGILLCLAFAFTVEALDYHRQRRGSFPRALARPAFWERIRGPFYWPLAVGIGLVASLLASEPLIVSLGRSLLEWLCLRSLEASIQHPGRTGSIAQFRRWLRDRWRQIVRTYRLWAGLFVLALLLSLVVNLSARGIWESVGHAGWNRLLIFAGGLVLIALGAFARLSRSVIRSSIQQGLESLRGLQADALDRALPVGYATGGRDGASVDYRALIHSRLSWKSLGSLLSRTGVGLEPALAQRSRWTVFLAGLLTFLLAMSFIALSIFLIVPRDAMVEWATVGQTQEPPIVFAVDQLEELFTEEYADRLLALDGSELAQDPLLKVAFLEAAIVMAALLLQTALDRSKLPLMAEVEPHELRWRLALGTAYLTLLESEFQLLTSGFVTRRLTGKRAPRSFPLRNEVLLVPSVRTRVGAYRAICEFLRLYGWDECQTPPCMITMFGSYPVAQTWAIQFLGPSSTAVGPLPDLDRTARPAADSLSERCWIWTGEQLVALNSLQEAQRYGRFVARSNNR
jgi:hypothetical protein